MAEIVSLPPPLFPSIQEALAAVKTDVGAVKKGERNSQQGFNFRGIDAVVNACAGPLNDHGVIVTPNVSEYVYETVEIGKNKTPMGHVTVLVKYTFHGPAGDSVESTVLAEAMDSGDKACAKAMSVAYRIALLQTLNLPTDEPDPDSTSYERSDGSAPVVRTGRPVKNPEIPKIADFPAAIAKATTVATLRDIWKAAGAEGKLTDDFKKMFYARNDELSFRESTEES